MRTHGYWIVAACLVFVLSNGRAQITNLVINGGTSNASMTAGDTVHWEYDINPPGATIIGQLWYDVNQNGTIDTATDKLRFYFTQTDGDTNGNGGPPDMDGAVNGHVVFKQHVGLAAGKYVFRFSYGADVHNITVTVFALGSPAHTISGTVTPPSGKSAQYIFVQARRNGNYDPNFWDAITDAGGNYTIAMGPDTAGNPWEILPADDYNPFPPAIITPQSIQLTISSASYTGNNFTFTPAAAQVAGVLKDENGNPLVNEGVGLSRNDGGVYTQGRADYLGRFQIGLTSGELASQTWQLQSQCRCSYGVTGAELQAVSSLPVIGSGDSLYRTLTVYTANSTITGQLTLNGGPPHFPIQLTALSNDTAQAMTFCDSASGNYILYVSTRISGYQVFPINLPPNFQSSPVSAHAGDTGVNINIIITSVQEREPGVPASFGLKQNFPNPFNPTTVIDYDIASLSHVTLAVFNILGQEVARLVDQQQHAGRYSAKLDASKLPSGVYLYRLSAGGFTSTQKMILAK